ncbi:hypothetical protein H072_4874 [Dactylellina haptotyla CBS 200.50]|uniref:Uncharacterized protein n=1 Tax=Dactylellina haptotyla (strain CBS 200.50) TaxID=1284197 RepID=S8C0Y8_DACHA|nr:hypothetical protein H072_4874 [Dactylellina haptotyla CBS 200.50]
MSARSRSSATAFSFARRFVVFSIIYSIITPWNRALAADTTSKSLNTVTSSLATSLVSVDSPVTTFTPKDAQNTRTTSSSSPVVGTSPDRRKPSPTPEENGPGEFDEEPETDSLEPISWASTITKTVLEKIVPDTSKVVYVTKTYDIDATDCPVDNGITVTKFKTVTKTDCGTPKTASPPPKTVPVPTSSATSDSPAKIGVPVCIPRLSSQPDVPGLISEPLIPSVQNQFCALMLQNTMQEDGTASFERMKGISKTITHQMGVTWLDNAKPGTAECKKQLQRIWDDCTEGESLDSPKYAGGRIKMEDGTWWLLKVGDGNPWDNATAPA